MTYRKLSDNSKHKNSVYNADMSRKDGGTSLKTSVTVNTAVLRELFGCPNDSIDDKVATQWILQDDRGHVLTVYKWKNHPTDYNIGAHSGSPAYELAEWLSEQAKRFKFEECDRCRRVIAVENWHTPTSCIHCNYSRVD